MLNGIAVQELFQIRQLFQPAQPTVPATGSVQYLEYPPVPALLPFVLCYWELRTDTVLRESFTYRVVADGCIDIFFEPGRIEEAYAMGFCKRYTEFLLGAEFRYIGIRFLPTAFPQLFGIDASLLNSRSESLTVLLPKFAHYLYSQIKPGSGTQSILDLLNQYLIDWLSKKRLSIDGRLYDALHLILQHQGAVAIEELLNTGISPRQLRRLFQYYVGDSPKTFSQIVRFQNILRAKPSTASLRKNKLFFDAGYYDQAHFIKEFRHFYGATPTQAFAT